mgnify:CR=1 FL=1
MASAATTLSALVCLGAVLTEYYGHGEGETETETGTQMKKIRLMTRSDSFPGHAILSAHYDHSFCNECGITALNGDLVCHVRASWHGIILG